MGFVFWSVGFFGFGVGRGLLQGVFLLSVRRALAKRRPERRMGHECLKVALVAAWATWLWHWEVRKCRFGRKMKTPHNTGALGCVLESFFLQRFEDRRMI